MKTLIDLDAVRQVINNSEVLMHLSWEDIGKLVEEIEKIKPEELELIRCKDCRYGYPMDDGKLCCNWPLSGRLYLEPNDFCSCAERREDEVRDNKRDEDA